MPVPGRDDEVEAALLDQRGDRREHLVPARDGERPSREEVLLEVDDDEGPGHRPRGYVVSVSSRPLAPGSRPGSERAARSS
jgi:hypothetical protein